MRAFIPFLAVASADNLRTVFESAKAKNDFRGFAMEHGVNVDDYTDQELFYFKENFNRLSMNQEHKDLVSSGQFGEILKKSAPLVTEKFVKELNSQGEKWDSEINDRFLGWSVHDVTKLQGTYMTGENAKQDLPIYDGSEMTEKEIADLPKDFDSRENWKNCPMIGHIRDQATCGSCWAFGSTEAFNDRLCIATKGKWQTLMSTQHTASCCNMWQMCFSNGCNGGNPTAAWGWMARKGVVTGGDNDDLGKSDTCWPYEIKSCAHHVKSDKLPPCDGNDATPSCKSSCLNKQYSNPFKKDKHTAATSYTIKGVNAIKKQLVTKGPVTAAFSVYADFPTYKSGVYEHKSGEYLGGHAIKIIGYGTEGGEDYWLVVNSWNELWGDHGLFKIKQGVLGIEDMVSAGQFESDVADAIYI